jgi:hypothetical protein
LTRAVTNNGETHLSNVTLINRELNYSENAIGPLAPRQVVMLTLEGKVNGDLKVCVLNPESPFTSVPAYIHPHNLHIFIDTELGHGDGQPNHV